MNVPCLSLPLQADVMSMQLRTALKWHENIAYVAIAQVNLNIFFSLCASYERYFHFIQSTLVMHLSEA